MSFTYAPGSKPLPQYTIRRGIGIGGFGEVYFALSEAGKEVALKRIQRNLDVELRGVSQCLNLKHNNLVALFDICRDSADQASGILSPSQIETIDMARRGIHNEGSEILIERLKDKVEIDLQTARRLFTLLCVLHFRG